MGTLALGVYCTPHPRSLQEQTSPMSGILQAGDITLVAGNQPWFTPQKASNAANQGLKKKKDAFQGAPWLSSGQAPAFSVPRAQVQSLVGELRSRKLCRGAKKKKKKSIPESYLFKIISTSLVMSTSLRQLSKLASQ